MTRAPTRPLLALSALLAGALAVPVQAAPSAAARAAAPVEMRDTSTDPRTSTTPTSAPQTSATPTPATPTPANPPSDRPAAAALPVATTSPVTDAAPVTAMALGASTAQREIVDATFVEQALARGAIVWDVRPRADFLKGHVPGAVNIDDAARVLRDPNREDFLPLPRLERLLGDAGIDPAQEIVVYGTRGSANAYFGQFVMQAFGGRQAHVFHDGIDGWKDGGRTISTQPAVRAPVELRLKPDPARIVETDDMLKRLGRADVQIIDARTAGEFRGEDIRAIRGGHIPGAVNIPHEANWVDPETPAKLARRQVADNAGMALKDEASLRRLYAGLDPDKETVVYCQSGVRAAETASVLRDLGFRDVKVYDASWLGWAARLAAPVEQETFVNVGALNGQLAAMQRRIEALEKALEQAQARARPDAGTAR